MTIQIKSRTYTVEPIPTPELTAKDLRERGWDGQVYALFGVSGACYMAYKSATTGEYSFVNR